MKLIRVLLCRLCIIAWSLLRVVGVVLLIPVALIFVYGGVEFWESRNRILAPPVQFVCGKMAGNLYQFHRQYFPFSPEYEGKDLLGSGFSNNKSGCDAHLRSIFLAMSWPDLQPAKDHIFLEQGLEYEGLLVSIAPVADQQDSLPMLRSYWLSQIAADAAAKIEYDDLLRLYRAEGFDAGWEHGGKIYLWSEEDGRMTSFIKCSWQSSGLGFYSCKMTFVVFDNLLVEATLRSEKVGHWSKMQAGLERFLMEKRIVK